MEIIQLHMKFQHAIIQSVHPASLMKTATCRGCPLMSRKGSKSERSHHFYPASVCSSLHLKLKGHRKITFLMLFLGLEANKQTKKNNQGLAKQEGKIPNKLFQSFKGKAFREKVKIPCQIRQKRRKVSYLKNKRKKKANVLFKWNFKLHSFFCINYIVTEHRHFPSLNQPVDHPPYCVCQQQQPKPAASTESLKLCECS